MADPTMSAAQGFLGGTGTGAAMGSVLLPGVGTVIGALMGGTLGAFSGASKAREQNSALAALNAIPNVDPNQTIFKDQLYREKRAVESGFTTDFQVARDIIGQQEAGGMSVAAEMAQSNPALALMAMTQTGQNADSAVNKALGTIGTRGMGYTSMIGDLIDKMSNRNLQLGLLKSQQSMTTATKGMQDFNANSNAGMMELMNPSVMSGISGLFSSPGIGSTQNPITSNFSNILQRASMPVIH